MSTGELEVLSAVENVGYGMQRIPSTRDFEILGFLKQASVTGLSNLQAEHGNTLTAFAERAASWAVRTGDLSLVKAGLAAIGRAVNVCDVREAMIAMSLLYRACEKIGAETRTVFADVSSRLGPGVQDLFDDFLLRNARDRSIEAMGFSEASDEDGFRFKCDWAE